MAFTLLGGDRGARAREVAVESLDAFDAPGHLREGPPCAEKMRWDLFSAPFLGEKGLADAIQDWLRPPGGASGNRSLEGLAFFQIRTVLTPNISYNLNTFLNQ